MHYNAFSIEIDSNMQYISSHSQVYARERRVPQQISILVGSMTGTADLAAEEIKGVLAATGAQVEILQMDRLDASVFARPGRFIICTSTYGQGDVPDNARAFFDGLQRERPGLGQVRYGVFGLGDSTYFDTFNNGGKQFDELLTELGARRIGQRMEHNASGDVVAEDAAVAWAKEWAELACPLAAAAE